MALVVPLHLHWESRKEWWTPARCPEDYFKVWKVQVLFSACKNYFKTSPKKRSWFYWQMSIENENRNCPSGRKDSRSSDCEVCGCLCVCAWSRGWSNNLLFSKKQQMDLTASILEVRGPSIVDLTQLSLQPWLGEELRPQPDLCLDVAPESREVLWQRVWGSPLAKGRAFSKESSKRSYHPVLRNQTTENERSWVSTGPSNPSVSWNTTGSRKQMYAVCSDKKRRIMKLLLLLSYFSAFNFLFLWGFIFSWAQGNAKSRILCH